MAGLLDWADPCVEAGSKFETSAAAARARADQAISEWDNRIEPPPEYRTLYVQAIREGAYKQFLDDPLAQEMIRKIVEADPNFEPRKFFFEKIYPKAIPEEKEAEFVQALYKADYEAKIRPQLLESKQKLEEEIQKNKGDLDGTCRPDLVSQVFRGTFGNALAILGNNWAAGQNENGEIAKYVRASTGVSITDIQTYGLQGGANSEINKLLGGENSALRQAIKALDITQWKIDWPQLPPLPELPPIPLPKIDWPKF